MIELPRDTHPDDVLDAVYGFFHSGEHEELQRHEAELLELIGRLQ